MSRVDTAKLQLRQAILELQRASWDEDRRDGNQEAHGCLVKSVNLAWRALDWADQATRCNPK